MDRIEGGGGDTLLKREFSIQFDTEFLHDFNSRNLGEKAGIENVRSLRNGWINCNIALIPRCLFWQICHLVAYLVLMTGSSAWQLLVIFTYQNLFMHIEELISNRLLVLLLKSEAPFAKLEPSLSN